MSVQVFGSDDYCGVCACEGGALHIHFMENT